MRDRLLILWLALLGASRIDLFGGEGPFLLTPFLVLSPLVVAAELGRLASRGWQLRLPAPATRYLLAVSALLTLLLASTFLSYDLASSGRRFSLLLVQVALVFMIGVAICDRRDPGRILLRGAYFGLATCFVFSAAQFGVWFSGAAGPLEGLVDLEARTYFGFIPRLTGTSHDANFGGFLVLFYLFLVLLFAAPSRLRSAFVVLGVVAVVLTLSRSAALAGLVLWGFLLLERAEIRVTARAPGLAAVVFAFATFLLLLVPGVFDPLLELSSVLGHRFTLAEGSTIQHAVILARGWEVGTESVKNVLIGIGYGNAYTVLQDVFPGNEYGNFHSLFVTLFAESGAPAALLAIWIFVHVFLNAGRYRPLVAALLVFNLLQQTHTEPFLWMSLFLAWVGVGTEVLAKKEIVPDHAAPEAGRRATHR